MIWYHTSKLYIYIYIHYMLTVSISITVSMYDSSCCFTKAFCLLKVNWFSKILVFGCRLHSPCLYFSYLLAWQAMRLKPSRISWLLRTNRGWSWFQNNLQDWDVDCLTLNTFAMMELRGDDQLTGWCFWKHAFKHSRSAKTSIYVRWCQPKGYLCREVDILFVSFLLILCSFWWFM